MNADNERRSSVGPPAGGEVRYPALLPLTPPALTTSL